MIDNPKVSVIMPCFLGAYEKSASNRVLKFNRAIQSFLRQTYENCEMVIIADGCNQTLDFIANNYAHEKRIKVFFIEKQELFSGNVRDLGLKASEGHYICYLDSDDLLKPTHVESIVNGFKNNPECDWVYFDDHLKFFELNHLPYEKRNSELAYGTAGTSNIAHRNYPEITWQGKNTYGHDWSFISSLMANYKDYKKIDGCGYVVCHIPDSFDS